jgi:uncharacterized protein
VKEERIFASRPSPGCLPWLVAIPVTSTATGAHEGHDRLTTNLAVWVVIGAAAAGFVQGLSGFAFGLIALAFWAWSVEPQLAGPMVVFGSLVGQMLAIGPMRRGFDLRRTAPFVIGGVLGVPLGVTLLTYIDPVVFKACVGALLAVYCPVMLLSRNLPYVTAGGRWADAGVGLIGGVMGGLGGLTGPVPTLWCALRGWDKDAQRAVFQAFNLSMQSLTLAVYAVNGTLTLALLPVLALMVPVAVVPTLAGAHLYRRFSGEGFRRLVLLLLLASGVT